MKKQIFPDYNQEHTTLVEVLQWRAKYQPNRIAYTFLEDGEEKEAHLTYLELDEQVKLIAAKLQDLDAEGERALLVYDSGLDYIAAFFGCLYAKVVAVPVFPPLLPQHISRLNTILRDSLSKIILTTTDIYSRRDHWIEKTAQLDSLNWIDTDKVMSDSGYRQLKKWEKPNIDRDTMAFLQYTSGSTSDPKGVIVSHENLMHNQHAIQLSFGHDENSTTVSWLPMFHDMGLIGNTLNPLYIGSRCIFMSPISFLQKPVRWLNAISRYQAHTSGAPNFAYEYCIKKIPPEERSSLDLSSWKIAYNGAEPVHAKTLEKFYQAFRDYGFRKEAFYPCFGMAESTLLVTGGKKSHLPAIKCFDKSRLEKQNDAQEIPFNSSKNAKHIVGCGHPIFDMTILIVDPSSLTVCKSGEIGEVWIDSPSVAEGYWRNDTKTSQVFGACLSDTGEGPFLRTGDLGFINDNELYITGRHKDLIIIRGRNYYPQDFEGIAEECDTRLQKGSGAAFSIQMDSDEKLVIIQEVKKAFEKKVLQTIAKNIKMTIAGHFNIPVFNVVLIERQSIFKTTSGKIQRSACKKAYDNEQLKILFDLKGEREIIDERKIRINDLATETERLLIGIFAKSLKIKERDVRVDDNFFGLGGDSLKAVEVIGELQEYYQYAMDANMVFEYPVLRDLAIIIDENRVAKDNQKPVPISSENNDNIKDVLFPVLPLQESFLINKEIGDVGCYIFLELTLSGKINEMLFSKTLEFLNRKHPVFSLSFVKTSVGYFQKFSSPPDNFFSFMDLTSCSEKEQNSAILKEAKRIEAHKFESDVRDPYQCTLIRRSDDLHLFIVNFDHLVIDGASVTKWLEELIVVYSKFVRNEKLSYDTNNASVYKNHIEYLKIADKSEFKNECSDFWVTKLKNYHYFNPLPDKDLIERSAPDNIAVKESFECYIQKVPADLLSKVKETSQRLNLTLFSFLFACFSKVIAEKNSAEKIIINTPFLNRKNHAFYQTSNIGGCFADILPVCLDSCITDNFRDLAHKVQSEISLISKYNLTSAVEIQRMLCSLYGYQKFQPISPIIFSSSLFPNRIGENRQEFTIDSLIPKTGAPATWLDVLVFEEKDNLILSWNYSNNKYSGESIQNFSENFEKYLNDFVSDMPDSRLIGTDISMPECLTSDLIENGEPESKHTTYEKNRCVHEIFEMQVEKFPNDIAIKFNDETYTYKEINEKGNQLARHIIKCSGEKQDIGIFLNRSPELIIAIIAILKAGKTYIPIDSDCPDERMNYILKNSDIGLIISQSNLKEKLSTKLNRRVIYLDQEEKQITQEEMTNLDIKVNPESLCYIIYTSGSTGKPKGVMICHRNVVRLFSSTRRWYTFTNKDNWCLFHSCAFDFSVWEIWGALFHGGTLVIVPYYISRFSKLFLELIIKEEITVLNQTPSAFLQIMTGLIHHKKDLLCLRLIIFGGEALPFPALIPWFKSDISDQVQLVNMYGITETTVHVTYCPVRKEQVYQNSASIIGEPIPDLQIYLLNDYKEPVSAGEIGELYIGGEGVSKGYMNRPDLTKERFLENPFERNSKELLYKSGDLGRYLPDGTLEYMGRSDNQVKIRGYRIELSEIDNVFLRYQGVHLAATVCSGKNKNIISYIVSDLFDDKDLKNEDIKRTDRSESNDDRSLGRFNFKNRAEIRLKDKSYDGVIENISFSGAKVTGVFPFSHHLNEKIKLAILSREKEICIDGRIVWYSDTSIGIQFDHIDPKRGEIRIPLQIRCRGIIDDLQREFPVNNISERGVSLIDEDYILDEKRCVRMEFNYPGMSNAQWQRGKVKWRDKEIVGLEFDQIPQQVRSGKRIRIAKPCDLTVGSYSPVTPGKIIDFSKMGAKVEIKDSFSQKERYESKIVLNTDLGGTDKRFSLEGKISWFKKNQFGVIFDPNEKNKRTVAQIYDYLFTTRGLTIPKLKEFLKLNLPKYMIPSAIVSLDKIPLNINGKIDLDALPNPQDYLYQQAGNFTYPEDLVEGHLLKLWEEILGIKMISTDENFFDIGGNSFLAVQLISRIKAAYDVDIPTNLIFQSLSIRNLSGYIQQHSKNEGVLSSTKNTEAIHKESNVVCIQSRGDNTPLFFIHPIGGNVYCYVNLSRTLGDELPFYAIQAFGLKGNPKVLQTIDQMSEEYMKSVFSIQKKGPYRVGGWSMGGIIAFEMARKLMAYGEVVENVFLIDSLLPSTHFNMAGLDQDVLIKRFIKDFYFSMGKRLAIPEEVFTQKDFLNTKNNLNEQLKFVIEFAIENGMVDKNTKETILKSFDVFIQNVEAMRNYHPGENFDGNLTYFRATEKTTTTDKMTTLSSMDYWKKICRGRFLSYNIEGNHYSIMDRNNVSQVANIMKQHYPASPRQNF